MVLKTDRIYYVCRYGLFSIISCIDTAYSYRPSSVVCRSSVGLFVIVVSSAKTAEPIKMQFGNMRTQVGRRNHVFNGDQSPHGKGQCEGETGQPVVKYSDSLP